MKTIQRFKQQLCWWTAVATGVFILRGIAASGVASAAPLRIGIPSTHQSGDQACMFPDGTGGSPGAHCYTPAQFMQAYGIDKLQNLGLTGKGQTIILVDSYGSPTQQNDLDVFSETFGLPRTKVQFIYPDGYYLNPMLTPDQQNWAAEAALDVQIAHAIAPGATIVNVVTNSDEVEGLTGLPDMFAGIQMALKQYPNGIVSMSFAAGEATFTNSNIQAFVKGQFHQILLQATQAGMTLLAGSGDTGSTSPNYADTSLFSFPDQGYPGVDPLVTSVGGTWLQAGWRWDPQGTVNQYWNCQVTGTCPFDFLNYVNTPDQTTEAVWKEDWLPAATGGGVSAIFQIPSYQATIGFANLFILNGQRGVPDVAMNAAVDGGFEIFTSFNAPDIDQVGPIWTENGGTSCSVPEMATLVALAGQEASETLHRNVGVGSLNPILYSLQPSDFNDTVPQTFGVYDQITLYNNVPYYNAAVLAAFGPLVSTPVPVPGYLTTRGYDLTTGWGSPNVVNFVNDVAAVVVRNNL